MLLRQNQHSFARRRAIRYNRGFLDVRFSIGTNPAGELPEACSTELHEPQVPHEPGLDARWLLERNVISPRRTRYVAAAATINITTINCQSTGGMSDALPHKCCGLVWQMFDIQFNRMPIWYAANAPR
jgi:hypothetical protein